MRLGVVGAGAMGQGIVQVAATGGIPVIVFDAMDGAAKRGLDQVTARINRLAEKGRLTSEEATAALALLFAAIPQAMAILASDATAQGYLVVTNVYQSGTNISAMANLFGDRAVFPDKVIEAVTGTLASIGLPPIPSPGPLAIGEMLASICR